MSGEPPRGLTVLVFAGGVASLGAEIAAARLLAPYFGASTIIWANTIAVVLVALSIGYWLGGKMADKRPRERDLRLVVLAAAVGLALIPLAAGPFLNLVADAFEDLDAAAFLGSLISVLILLALPLLLLGAITPWALKLSIRDLETSGQVAGRLYAVSTLGSLTGVFLASLVLVPAAGTQRTFMIFAAMLALAAAARPVVLGRLVLAVPVVLLAAIALPPGVTKPAAAAGRELLEERETPYQYARVLQDGDRRLLELNEGQAVHSIYDASTPLTGGVWDGYSVLPFSVLEEPPERMAMLGNAAGTVSRAYARYYPSTVIDGVEIDPGVTELGEEYFDLEVNERLTTYDEDARPFLRRTDEQYDMIGIDAYRQPYIPFYLATEEFFSLTRDRLTDDGVVVLNVGHPEGQDSLERTLTRTLRAVFPHVKRYAIEEESTLLVASEVEPEAERLSTLPAEHADELLPEAADASAGLQDGRSGGTVMTDDRAPVEWLVDSSLARYVLD